MLTYWSFLICEKCCVVATIHVSHAYVVTVSPVQLPEEGYECHETWRGGEIYFLDQSDALPKKNYSCTSKNTIAHCFKALRQHMLLNLWL